VADMCCQGQVLSFAVCVACSAAPTIRKTQDLTPAVLRRVRPMAAVGSRGRRSRAEWQSLIARAEGSALSMGAFCAAQGISTASFYLWSKRLGGDIEQLAPVARLSRSRRARRAHARRGGLRQGLGAGARAWRWAGVAPESALMFFPVRGGVKETAGSPNAHGRGPEAVAGGATSTRR
jgi:hypothetical protein